MSNLAPARNTIQAEEVAFKGAGSENCMGRIGATVNLNSYNLQIASWSLNGPSSAFVANKEYDGGRPILFNAEIIGLSIFQYGVGSSGAHEFEIFRTTAPNTTGVSLFSTRPKINTGDGGPHMALFYDFLNGVQKQGSANCVNPVLASNQLNAGDMLYFYPTSLQVGAVTCSLSLLYRPR